MVTAVCGAEVYGDSVIIKECAHHVAKRLGMAMQKLQHNLSFSRLWLKICLNGVPPPWLHNSLKRRKQFWQRPCLANILARLLWFVDLLKEVR